MVTTTYSDDTATATIALSVYPRSSLLSIWVLEVGTWLGFSPQFPHESDLTEVDFLDVVFICVSESAPGSASFSRPVL